MWAIHSTVTEVLEPEIDWALYEHGILESPASVRFIKVDKRDFVAGEYSAGLLFGEQAEVRWRKRRDGMFHLVFIDEGEGEPLIEERQSSVVLWGDATGDGIWSEGRIPGLLTEYPAEFSGKRLAIDTVQYRLEKDGEEPVFLFRCKKLASVERKENGDPASL